MSTNCIKCVKNERTGPDLLCDDCRAEAVSPLGLAKEAIRHTLNAICNDPRKYWLCGNGTGTFEKLTAAHAALHGISVETVRANFVPDKKRYDQYCEERKEHERLREIGAEYLAKKGGVS